MDASGYQRFGVVSPFTLDLTFELHSCPQFVYTEIWLLSVNPDRQICSQATRTYAKLTGSLSLRPAHEFTQILQSVPKWFRIAFIFCQTRTELYIYELLILIEIGNHSPVVIKSSILILIYILSSSSSYFSAPLILNHKSARSHYCSETESHCCLGTRYSWLV